MTETDNAVPVIDDDEIQRRVESLAGKNARILDCEKKSSLVTEEVLMLNGQKVELKGDAGEQVKKALKAGLAPPPELLSQLLSKVGISKAPVQVETVMSVKSNTKTSELSTLMDRDGNLVDEKMKEFEEDDEYESTNVEVWEKEVKKTAEDLMSKMESEKNKMFDFYKNATGKEFKPGKVSGPLKEVQVTNITEEIDRVSSRSSSRKSTPTPAKSSMNQNIYKDHLDGNNESELPLYENLTSSNINSRPEFQNHSKFTDIRNSQNAFHTQDNGSTYENVHAGRKAGHPESTYENVFSRQNPGESTYENVSFGVKNTGNSPGRMPPILNPPSNLKVRPPVPPKPAHILNSKLRSDGNIRLPVRVVYETFI